MAVIDTGIVVIDTEKICVEVYPGTTDRCVHYEGHAGCCTARPDSPTIDRRRWWPKGRKINWSPSSWNYVGV